MNATRPNGFLIPPGGGSSRTQGFTLVEMMVSVALVLMMMLLFSQVFQAASKSMSQQKGMAENDQKARLLTILMRGELAARTFRDIKPFPQGADTGAGGSLWNASDRRGYFYISENSSENDTNDILQFTIEVPATELPLAARTSLLKDPPDTLNGDGTVDLGSTTMTTEHIPLNDYLVSNYNQQPEFDDGQMAVNYTGSSRSAEVCYFVRNGNLYRRFLLVRNSYEGNPDAQPRSTTGRDYDSSLTVNGSGQFLRDFAYSAFHLGRDTMGNSYGMLFHTRSSLTNSSVPALYQLGHPTLRFGWTPQYNDGSQNPYSRPREYLYGPDNQPGTTGVDDDGNGTPDDEFEAGYGDDEYIGRFTSQETAHSNFGYPGRSSATANPYDPLTQLSLDSATGLVSAYSNEIYGRGEDIVLTNVHSFDIKVWDGLVKDWVDLGHSRSDSMGNPGHYNRSRCLNAQYGANRYDTWHPLMPSGQQPPYRPVSDGNDGQPGDATVDDDGNATTDDASEQGHLGTDDEIPLKAIQITIRYYDLASNQLRQVTLVHSLIK